MHIILEINSELAKTGSSVALFFALFITFALSGFLVITFRNNKKQFKAVLSSVLVFALVTCFSILPISSKANASLISAKQQTFRIAQGQTQKADAEIAIDQDGYTQIYAKLADNTKAGISVKMQNALLSKNFEFVVDTRSQSLSLPLEVSVANDFPNGRYEFDIEFSQNAGGSQNSSSSGGSSSGGNPSPTNPPSSTSNASYGNCISMDNSSNPDTFQSFWGGDLIIKEDCSSLSSTPFSSDRMKNVIKVDGEPCITTGSRYLPGSANSDNVARIGCVIPKLDDGNGGMKNGDFEVTVSIDGGADIPVGVILYDSEFSNCKGFDSFSANGCKGQLSVGQSVGLSDSRGGYYRAKKMVDGNVWMIDNYGYDLANGNDGYYYVERDPGDPTQIISSSLVDLKAECDAGTPLCGTSSTNAQFYPLSPNYDSNSNRYGVLYNWCVAIADTSQNCADSNAMDSSSSAATSTILYSSWRLPTGFSTGEYATLRDMMLLEGQTNPVYSSDPSGNGLTNFLPDSPFQGTYPGVFDYNSGSYHGGGLLFSLWTASADSNSGSSNYASCVSIDSGGIYANDANMCRKDDLISLRAII